MNYEKIYFNLIERGKTRKKEKNDGLHQHRIVPGHEGGKYKKENITFLTQKEHMLIHKLRYHLYKNPKDIFSSSRMKTKLTEKELKNLRTTIGKLGGLSCFNKKVGVFSLSSDQHRINQLKGIESRKEKIKNDPEYKEKQRLNGVRVNKTISKEKRQIGGIKTGKINKESGHCKKIAHLGGAVHKGRKIIFNVFTNQRKRPTLEKAEFLVKTGEWKYLKTKVNYHNQQIFEF